MAPFDSVFALSVIYLTIYVHFFPENVAILHLPHENQTHLFLLYRENECMGLFSNLTKVIALIFHNGSVPQKHFNSPGPVIS